jgi:hypothetical protein
MMDKADKPSRPLATVSDMMKVASIDNDRDPKRIQPASRQSVALRQISTAIRLFHEGNYECAIALSLAAEHQLPSSGDQHLFSTLCEFAPEKIEAFYNVRNRLTHPDVAKEVMLTKFHCVVALIGAISRFNEVYHASTEELEEFIKWVRSEGHLGPPVRPHEHTGPVVQISH